MTLTRRLTTLMGAAVLVAALGACSSDTTSGSTGPTAAASLTPSTGSTGSTQVCTAADAARASLQELASMRVLAEGTDAVKAQVAVVKTDVAAVVDAARADFAPQAEALQQAMDSLEASVKDLGASPSASAVVGVGAAVVPVTTALNQLRSELSDRC